MPLNINQFRFINEFECLGSACEDTCCQGWDMQVNKACFKKYQTQCPELLEYVVSGESGHIMKRDGKTDLCLCYKDGLCTLHKEKGKVFLGDACNFYPRITRKYADKYIMSAALSCPEIVRKIFFNHNMSDNNPFDFVESSVNRLPEEITDYLPEDISGSNAQKIIKEILNFIEEDSKTADRIMSCLVSVFISLKNLDIHTWSDAIAFYLKMSNDRLLPVENDEFDMCNLVLFLSVLIFSSKKKNDSKLNNILKNFEESLGIKIDKKTLEMIIEVGKTSNTEGILAKWKEIQSNDSEKQRIQKLLKRYILSQITMSGYPFSGLGNDLQEKTTIFAVKYALFKLSLMSYLYNNNRLPDDDDIVKNTYIMSRFIDHISDPILSIKLYNHVGWNKEGRLRSIIGDYC